MIDQIIAIDLGARSTKAVCLQKIGESLSLVGYTIKDRPDAGKPLSAEALSKHLNSVVQGLTAKPKEVIFVLGAADSLISHAEMMLIGISEMRKMVMLSPKNYFQEDLPNYSFDCFVLHQVSNVNARGQISKARTLIVAAKNQLLLTLKEAASLAKLSTVRITASQIDAANCFLASSEAARNKVVALADIGFSHSTLSVLVNGEITLTRVVNIGADKFTSGLAEEMSISYSIAEGLKQMMPEKVESQLQTLITPLCHELNNSIHFFEQQQDEKVSEVYVSGGSVRTPFVVEFLQSELALPCKIWDPTSSLKVELPPAQSATLKQDAPQLTVAIGAALSWFNPKLPTIDLLAEEKEQAELRQRDPMKRAYVVAASLVVMMLLWCGFGRIHVALAEKSIRLETAALDSLQQTFSEADRDVKKSAELDKNLSLLEQIPTKRYLLAPALNALQYTVVENFQMVRLQITQQLSETKTAETVTNASRISISSPPSEILEKTVFTIQAKSFAKPPATESFVGSLAASPWFKNNLRSKAGIRVTRTESPVVDTNEPNNVTMSFTVECYSERKL